MAEAVLERQRHAGSPEMLALALHQLGRIYQNTGRYQEAAGCLDEALDLWSRLGDLHGTGNGSKWSLIDRGQVARFLGDPKLAIACFGESIRLFGPDPLVKYPTLSRGWTKFELGDLAGALEDYRFCLRQSLSVERGWTHFVVLSLAGCGEVAWERGQVADAARLLAASMAWNEAWQAMAMFGVPLQIVCFERSMAAAAEHRSNPVFEGAWQEGEKLTLQEAVDLALEV